MRPHPFLFPMPDSDATTVPASAEEVKKFKSGIAHHVQKTPTPKGKVVENQSSEPKIKKQIQSKRILEEDEGKNEKKPARTAVKAKPQPRQQPDQVAKAEVGGETPRTAKAVQECLKRASTAEILHKTPKTGSTTTPSTAPRHGSDEPCSPESQNSRAESDEESADEEEWAKKAAQAKAKRQAHARFMRFSRSLKSIWAKFTFFGLLLPSASTSDPKNQFTWAIFLLACVGQGQGQGWGQPHIHS